MSYKILKQYYRGLKSTTAHYTVLKQYHARLKLKATLKTISQNKSPAAEGAGEGGGPDPSSGSARL